MSLKNDWRIVYNSIYYVSQSKIEWKMSEKMTQEYYIRLYTMIFSQKLNEKFEWRIIYKLYTMFLSQKFEWKMK